MAITILTLGLFVNCVLLIRTCFITMYTPRLTPRRSAATGAITELVSVLVPARNEAHRVLAASINSMLTQGEVVRDVIVVDDRSTDDTRVILAQLQQAHGSRLRVIDGLPPPSGWLGKTWAVQQAKEVADSEWLLMTDADVVFEPWLVTSAIQYCRTRSLDALSLLPRVEMVSLFEMIVLPVVCWFSIMRVSPTQASRPSTKACFGYGPFILVHRAAHAAIGGCEAYRDDVLDDCALMERIKRSGRRVAVAYGHAGFHGRLYAGLPEIFRGFGKNSYAALNNSPILLVGVLAIGLLTVGIPFVALTSLQTDALTRLLSIANVIAVTITMAVFWSTMGGTLFALALWPIGYAVSLMVFLYSMWLFEFSPKGATWRGRAVQRGQRRWLTPRI